MSGISGTNPQVDLRALLGDFTEIKQEARQSVENALVMLGTVIAGNSLNRDNLQELPPPSFSMLGGIAELSLRIGLIQDALDQLMQEVSKLGISQRLNQADRANQEQIARIAEQVAEAKEAAAKSKEAEEKGNFIEDMNLLNFRKPDVNHEVGFKLTDGVAVTFQVYVDNKGAGAFEVSKA